MPNGDHYIPSHEDYHRFEEKRRSSDEIIKPIKAAALEWLKKELPLPVTKQGKNFIKSADIVDKDILGAKLTCKVNAKGGWEIQLEISSVAIGLSYSWPELKASR